MEQQDMSHVRFLVVDDYPMTRNLVKSILRGIGFSDITLADDGGEAIRIILEGNIDFVICDWNMPRATGLEVLRTVRQQEAFKKLPFLMLTAEAYKENVVAALQSGCSDYVVKPFTSDIIIEKVKKILGSK